jgi:hypothetical protein
MLDRPDDRDRIARKAALRRACRKRHEQRLNEGKVVVPTVLGSYEREKLRDLNYVTEAELNDPKKLRAALGRALVTMVRLIKAR